MIASSLCPTDNRRSLEHRAPILSGHVKTRWPPPPRVPRVRFATQYLGQWQTIKLAVCANFTTTQTILAGIWNRGGSSSVSSASNIRDDDAGVLMARSTARLIFTVTSSAIFDDLISTPARATERPSIHNPRGRALSPPELERNSPEFL